MADNPNYLTQRLNQARTEKQDALSVATQEKVAALREIVSRPVEQDNSWVGQLGLTPGSVEADTVNLGANVVAGASRLVGNIASLPYSGTTGLTDARMDQAQTEAYNRYKQGTQTPEDMVLLNTKQIAAPGGGFVGAKASMTATPSNALTPLEAAQQADATRETARKIQSFFDITGIEHAGSKNELNASLGDQFRAGADQISQGWTALKGGEYASAAKGIAGGIAELLVGAGEAAVTNPQAVAEYVAENAPQLLVGGLGAAGKASMAASNVGYAADYYQKGIENFQAKNQGQMPSVEDRAAIAAWAASLAVAEQAGDMAGLAAMKLGSGAAKTGVKGVIAGTAQGGLTEAVTEGYQTFAEGKATGVEASAEDIYKGAVIGGLSGAALSGGVRAIQEVTGATPEAQQARTERVAKDIAFKTAVEANTPEVFLDKEGSTYDPALAAGVVAEQFKKEGNTPEQELEYVKQASKIVDDLETRTDELKQVIKNKDASKAEVREAQREMMALERHYRGALKVSDELFNEWQKKQTPADVEATVEASNKAEATKEAVDTVINLSMASSEKITPEQALELASNEQNNYTPEQRNYLRTYGEARTAEANLKSMEFVNQEVLHGSDKNMGITKYRQQIGAALATRNVDQAQKLVGLLSAFTTDHAAKSKAARQAFSQFGLGAQIIKTDAGWEVAAKGTYSKTELKGKGLMLNTPKLVKAIASEAVALSKAQAEMQAAVALRFPTESVQLPTSTQQTNPESPQKQAKTPVVSSTYSSISTSRIVEAETRLENESLEKPSPEAPQEKKKEESVAKKPQVSKVEEKSSTLSSPSPTSETSVPVLADARTDSVSSSATVENGVLDVFSKASKDTNVEYTQRNLVADNFEQNSGKDADTVRPLASVKNFLSEVRKGTVKVAAYVTNELDDAQKGAVKNFAGFAKKTADTIKSNLVKGALPSKEGKSRDNPEFYFNDLIQFFIEDNVDVEENIKTAIAYGAYSWLVENASNTEYNTKEEINLILGRDEDTEVTNEEWNKLGSIGIRGTVVMNSLGQRVVQSLGLKLNANAPINLLPQLESIFGAHALKLLESEGLIQRNELSGQDMAALTKSKETSVDAKHKFIKVIQSDSVESIKAANKGTKGVLNKLFGVESSNKEPSFAPIPFEQKTTKNTDQQVPKELAKIIEHENAQPNLLRQDMWQVVSQLSPEVMLEIAGVQQADESVHTVRRKSIEAKNDGLKREYENAMEFFGSMGDLAQPMYFEHSVWKQQRVGISTNVINPQTSKIHRHMLYRPTWDTEVQMNDMDHFYLRVAEGLGVKTDKQDNVKSLKEVATKLEQPEVKAAIAVLVKAINGSITKEDQIVLKDGIDKAGENMHSFDALMAMAHYEDAKARNKTSFKVQMMGEVDGVTNGPMLSHLLMGAAPTSEQLYALLNKGGFYTVDDNNKNYNLWRSVPGRMDLYETTTSHMLGHLDQVGLDQATKSALYFFTGNLGNETKVEKAGRNIIKTPLTAMVFGSSVPSAIDSMAEKFVESIYTKIEKVNAGEGDIQELLNSLNVLGLNVGKLTAKEMMELEFTKAEREVLKNTFKESIGKAVEATMKQDFEMFLEERTKFNNTAQLSFELYNAAYTAIRDEYVAELVESGDIPSRTPKQGKDAGKKVAIADLNKAQYRELDKRLKAIKPVMHTAMSKESDQITAGLMASKSGRKLSDRQAYKGNAQFGTPFADGSTSVQTRAYERTEEAPGVAMAPMSVHSTDSAISHRAAFLSEVLNVHDAHGAGLGNFIQAAQNLNQQTWNTMLTYSPASEMADTLLRVVAGVADLIENPAVQANVTKVLVQVAEKQKTNPASVLDIMVRDTKQMAFRADDMKLQAMEIMGAVDQYALEGGHYEVTDSDRKKASEARKALKADIPAEYQAALDKVAKVLSTELKANTKVKVAQTKVKADPKLVKYFKEQPLRTIADIEQQLQNMNLTGFQSKLLTAMSRVLGSKAELTSVRFVDNNTPTDQVLEQPKKPSHAWYVAKEGRSEIYIAEPTVETILHEMVHATVAKAIAKPTKEAQRFINELEQIRGHKDLQGFKEATSSVQELVAYGMTNEVFQAALKKIQFQTENNAFVTGLKKFIDTLVGLVFGKQNTGASTAMEALITNVAGLMQEAKNEAQVNVNQSMAMGTAALTTEDIFAALDSVGMVQPSTAFKAYLESLLSGLVAKVQGPLSSFASTVQHAATPMDAWAEAKVNGSVPFGNSSLASGLPMSEQEAFVIEQIEVTVRSILEDKEGNVTSTYRELVKLYNETKAKLKPSDFPSQAAYDFVFDVTLDAGNRSKYLSRFVALGLANEKMNSLLNFNTAITRESFAGKTMAEKIHEVFDRLLTWVTSRITHTFEGQKGDEKLLALVQKLVDIDQKKRMKLAHSPSVMLDSVEGAFRSTAEAGREAMAKFGQSKLFQSSKNGYVKFAGTAMTMVAQDRVFHFMDKLQQFRDIHFHESQGVMAGIVNEVRGSHIGNLMFHKLLRLTKAIEGRRKELITNTTQFVMDSFKDGGEYLTQEMKAGLSAAVLRTDASALLDDFSMANIAKLMEDRTYLSAQIKVWENKLTGKYKTMYINSADALGYRMATGKVGNAHVMMNAENIAHLRGTSQAGKVSAQEATTAEHTIDVLASLYALQYTSPAHMAETVKVLKEEAGRNEANGVEFMMRLHKYLQEESRDRLFQAAGSLRMKGYTPEMYNPYIEVKVAEIGSDEAKELEALGFEAKGKVSKDKADPDQEAKMIYAIRDGGLNPHLTGVFSYTGMRAKGTQTHNGDKDMFSSVGLMNNVKMNKIQGDKQAEINNLFTQRVKPTGTHMAPVFNAVGDVVNYRYMMQEDTKDNVLERDNRFEQILGAMAGSIFDKEMTKTQNHKAVEALKEQYDLEFNSKPHSYIQVGPNSTDKEMREIWRLLPEGTKQSVREVWGQNYMMVRIDLLDINFGYRKKSISDPFGIPEAERTKAQALFVETMELIVKLVAGDDKKKRAGLYLKRGEDVWQALVREAKDTLVVKSGVTLAGNFMSNLSELIWFGVPMTEIIKHHRVALKGVLAYRKESKELDDLQLKLSTNYLPAGNRQQMEDRVKQLKDSMARNPVRELIEAGMMPTIVEDVAADEDIYSFKSKMTQKVEEFGNRLNPAVLQAGKYAVIAHDTPLYHALSYGTQISDFLARYTLYQYQTSKKQEPMGTEKALQLVSDAFVNYDIPSHRTVQYANDVGLVYFTKYYLRIQKVIALLYQQNPGRALMLLTLGHFLDFLPMLTHSAVLARIGNPFSMGALEAIGAVDDLATVNALMSPFR